MLTSNTLRILAAVAVGGLLLLWLRPSVPDPEGEEVSPWLAALEAHTLKVMSSLDSLHFPDPGLSRCVRLEVEKRSRVPPQNSGSIEDAREIPYLDCTSYRIHSLQGIDALQGLTSVSLASNQIVDLSPLVYLPKLERLDVSDNPLASVAELTSLPALRTVHLPDMPNTLCREIEGSVSGLKHNLSAIRCLKDRPIDEWDRIKEDSQQSLRESEAGIREYETQLRRYP